MATYPTRPRAAFLSWCQSHDGDFVTHAAALGLTAAQAEVFQAATEAAMAANLAQAEAQEAAKAATLAAKSALSKLLVAAGDTVRTIRAFAELQPEPVEVYALARIPSPAGHSPAPPPAEPKSLTATLDYSSGAVTVRWKARNPDGTSGTTYLIQRRLPGEAAFTFIGVAGIKEFVDQTVVAGTEWVEYMVQGQRANVSGPASNLLRVNFGRQADGARIAMAASMARGNAAASIDIGNASAAARRLRHPVGAV